MSEPISSIEEQIALAEKLQLKLLQDFDRLIDSDDITPTDRATLARLLMQNGWNLDPARLPKGLHDKLLRHVALDENDDVIPIHRTG